MGYDDEPYEDALCDAYGNEYMRIEDHEEAMDDFKQIGATILKEMILAAKNNDIVAMSEAIDEMAEHLGATI